MHADHDAFIAGIDECKKIALTFVSKEDGGGTLVRTCAPMDFGPSSRAKNKSNRYHSWDYDSDSPDGRHTLSLLPEQVISIKLLEEGFDPSEFVSWPPDWHYPRDWGTFS